MGVHAGAESQEREFGSRLGLRRTEGRRRGYHEPISMFCVILAHLMHS